MPKWFSLLALPTVLGLLHADMPRMRRRPLGFFAMQPAVDGTSAVAPPSTTKWPDGFSSESHRLVLQRVAEIPGFEALSASLKSKDAAAAHEALLALIDAHDDAALKTWVQAQQQQPSQELAPTDATAKISAKRQRSSARGAAVAAVDNVSGDGMKSSTDSAGNSQSNKQTAQQLSFPLGEAELHWMVAASAQFSYANIKQKSWHERGNSSQTAATTSAPALACSLGQTSVKLLARIRALGVLPSETTYYHCLHALRRLGEVDKVGPVFRTLIDVRAHERDLAQASDAAAAAASEKPAVTPTSDPLATTIQADAQDASWKEGAVNSATAAGAATPPFLRSSLWGLAISCEASAGNTEAALTLLERSAVENGDSYQIPPDHYDHLFLRYASVDDLESGLSVLHHLASNACAAPTKAALVTLFTCLRKAHRFEDVLDVYRAYANYTLEPPPRRSSNSAPNLGSASSSGLAPSFNMKSGVAPACTPSTVQKGSAEKVAVATGGAAPATATAAGEPVPVRPSSRVERKKKKMPLLPEVELSQLEGWPVEVDYNLAVHVCASCEATGRWREAVHALDAAAAYKQDTDAALVAADAAAAAAAANSDDFLSSTKSTPPRRRIGRLDRVLARKKIAKEDKDHKEEIHASGAAPVQNVVTITTTNASNIEDTATPAVAVLPRANVPVRSLTSLEFVVHSSAAAACVKAGQPMAALQVFADMKRRGIQPGEQAYTAAITAVAYSSSSEAGKEKPSWASAFYLLNEMLDVLNHSQVTSPEPFTHVINACSRHGRQQEANAVLAELLARVDGPPVTTDAKAKGSAESIGASDSHEDCTRSSSRDKEIARVGERRIVLDYDAYSAAITMHQRFGNVEGAQGMFARLLRQLQQEEEQQQQQKALPDQQPSKGKERGGRRGRNPPLRRRGSQPLTSAAAVTCDAAMYRRMLNVYYQAGLWSMAVSLLQDMSGSNNGQGGLPAMVVPSDMIQLARRTFGAGIPITPQGREDKEAALKALDKLAEQQMTLEASSNPARVPNSPAINSSKRTPPRGSSSTDDRRSSSTSSPGSGNNRSNKDGTGSRSRRSPKRALQPRPKANNAKANEQSRDSKQ